ncbi:MAG: Na/Pi cotransporter family protein [Clostridia bacterium]|nr:Na/Pi cotransporter family protein [Clostridia bacterium]
MDLFAFLTLVGGLAIFLFGMNVMGDGLERCGGNKLKKILENVTQNPLKGILLGLGVTAIIQSSSATTVMVVGFVNSGIMKLSQSISIIMGANIGTTVTAWLLSLTGLESSNLFVQLLKPSSFSPVLAIIGISLMMFSKNSKKKDIGSVMIGFAVLITGMDMMSGAVSGLKDNEAFTSIFTLFSNPILGILTGAILTAIIQSSSASVGILQALSTTGSVTYSNAIPIILGQNIGTCITAILSAIGTTKNARRAAVVHLSFNVIGTVSFAVLFYTIKAFIDLPFISNSINAVGIAVIHTIFNVLATAIMLPFIKQLEKLACIIIPDNDVKEKKQLLDERLLLTPPVALSHAKNITVKMAHTSKSAIDASLGLIGNFDAKEAEKVNSYEDAADMYEDCLGDYLVKLCRESLNASDSREVSSLLHCIGDFERISDHAVNICDVARELDEKGIVFSDAAQKEIKVMCSALSEIISLTVDAFEHSDLKKAQLVEPLEETVDYLRAKLKEGHVARLKDGECTIETGFIFSDFLINCERVSDHCSNIAACMLETAHESFEMHGYLSRVKEGTQNDFNLQCEFYKKKYAL